MSKTSHKLRKPRYLTKGSVGKGTFQSQSTGLAPSTETVERNIERDMERDIDKEYLVRALSHDVGAHLMLLEFSFRHYDELVQRQAGETQPRLHLSTNDFQSEKPSSQPVRLHLVSQEATALSQAASHVTACFAEMKRFVNDLISFAKTGNIDMEPSSVKVATLVDEVLFEQRQLIEKRKIEVVVSSSLPTVFANPKRVKQVLTNLIRNAAIHGCDVDLPMIVIASEWGHDTNPRHTGMVGFSVRDNGCGIAQADCVRVFDPGYRVSGNQNEGSGIGLAIVKKIACYYGGDVVCQSNGNGTTFVVTLPRAKSHKVGTAAQRGRSVTP